MNVSGGCIMRVLVASAGLFAAISVASVAMAVEAKDDDRSYLPPAALRATPDERVQKASLEPARKAPRVIHKARQRTAYPERRSGMRPFFFGIF
jgi:hypothetical protein